MIAVLAASAVIYALDNNLERLSTDHEHARLLAGIVEGAGGSRVVPPDTNIVMVDLPDGATSEAVEDGAR